MRVRWILCTAVLALLAAFHAPRALVAGSGADALAPAGTGGIDVVDAALAKLSTHRRLLVVGAHPDDEDTNLLVLVSRGQGGEAAYLSLSRGEGGQNLIGPELGVGLGLVRTGELLAARGVESTRQYFTRAFDFGYTRSLEETISRWPPGVLEEDAVAVVRRFKPQVVIAVFPADERAGHGQHQMSAVIARQLFELAGEPDRFPALTAAGLPPWQPKVVYRRLWREGIEPSLSFPLATVDPLSGKSVVQIAALSRSMHRSQDMGTEQKLGPRTAALSWVAGRQPVEDGELFAGVDTRLAAIASVLPEGAPRRRLGEQLERVEGSARAARRALSPVGLEDAAGPLVEIVSSLRAMVEWVERDEGRPTGAVMVADLLEEKLQAASSALAAASGIAVDAVADREAALIGGSLEATATVWNTGEQQVTLQQLELLCGEGWRVTEREKLDQDPTTRRLEQWRFVIAVEPSASPTLPYPLRRSLQADLYDWEGLGASDRGEPLTTPPLVARFELLINGVPVALEREVVYRYADQTSGEVRRPLRAVPEVEVAVVPDLILWPLDSATPRELEVIVSSNSEAAVRGRLELRFEGSWPEVAAVPIAIAEPGGRQVARIRLDAPPEPQPGRVSVMAEVVIENGRRFGSSYPLVSYPHIRPLPLEKLAAVDIRLVDLELPPIERLGYILGAADRVPEILSEVGLPVELLQADQLANSDLSVFDAIVIGSRAYETDDTLATVNSRLLDFVRDGGLLLVQYQQYQFVRGGYPPYRLEISRPHGRVTDESSRVRLLAPEHPAFNTPNRIGDSDWQGWVQERGLYFAGEWDEAYLPLLELQDSGGPQERGALLVARLGKGTYAYSGLSFFRQLPAGVPGAVRLFVNLLALARPERGALGGQR